MKASEAFPSKYLAADDLQDKPALVKITHIATDAIGGKEKFILYFAGKTKGLVLNKTNWNNIAKICGDDSDDWTGQEIVLFPTMVDFQGESVPAIRVRAKKRDAAPSRQEQSDADERDPIPSRQVAAPRGGSRSQDMNDDIPFGPEVR